MCARGVEERNTMRTSGEKRNDPLQTKNPTTCKILHRVGAVLHQVQVLTFCGFLLDCIDYVADAVLGCPRWTDQRGKETNKVGDFLFTLDDSLLVLADFGCLKFKRVAEVVVGFAAYLCACR